MARYRRLLSAHRHRGDNPLRRPRRQVYVMAFFGYPQAHDNDAERAIRASLAIRDAVSKLNNDPSRPKLSARIGIDSGVVVVGAGAGKEADIFGGAPNIAARVQEAAVPGTV